MSAESSGSYANGAATANGGANGDVNGDANGAAKALSVLESSPVTEALPVTIPDVNQQYANVEIPDNHFQLFQTSLFEHDFTREEAFVSASLQRLQHGIYHEVNRLKHTATRSQVGHVTFVAATFVLHPMHSSDHRFKRAQISIQAHKALGKPAKATDQPLLIVKFAPHLSYGRISTENLHWTFSLGPSGRCYAAPLH